MACSRVNFTLHVDVLFRLSRYYSLLPAIGLCYTRSPVQITKCVMSWDSWLQLTEHNAR